MTQRVSSKGGSQKYKPLIGIHLMKSQMMKKVYKYRRDIHDHVEGNMRKINTPR